MMPEHKSARRPTAFVSGGAQGIGAAIAVALARDGFDVAVSSRRIEALSDVTREIAAAGARALPVALDVLSPSSIEQAMAAAVTAFGELDVLVSNAAVTLIKPALDVTPDDWQNVIATNLTGGFFMNQQMGRHLLAAGRPGSIVNVASTHGIVGFPARSTYGISKAAIMHMTKMLAIEWAAQGIRVNAIAPGTVLTPSRVALAAARPGYLDTMLNRIPLRRMGTTAEVAAAVCYLVSPAAAYITGQTLVLDGGLTSY